MIFEMWAEWPSLRSMLWAWKKDYTAKDYLIHDKVEDDEGEEEE